jgi:uncharacterized protein
VKYLPDVNVVLALLDPMHLHHEEAHAWYARRKKPVLLLCEHVVNGVLRVASQEKYPNSLGTVQRVREVLREFCRKVPHQLCDRQAFLLDEAVVLKPMLLTPSTVSDLYLLALAVAHEARLATFDRKISVAAIEGGEAAMELVGGAAASGKNA